MPERTKKPIIITNVTLPVAQMAASFLMTEEEMIDSMRDGRGAFPFSEIWGARYCRMTSVDYRGETRPPDIIGLGKSRMHFQRSKRFGGGGRSGDVDALLLDLRGIRSVIVVDLRRFPELHLVDIPSADLIGAAEAGALTIHGWSGKAFDKWLQGHYAVRRVTVHANRFTRARGPHMAVSRTGIETSKPETPSETPENK